MSKETTLVMYLEVKYFIPCYSDVMYCLPDFAFCLRSGIWDHLWGWIPASPVVPRVPFSQGTEFLPVPTKC